MRVTKNPVIWLLVTIIVLLVALCAILYCSTMSQPKSGTAESWVQNEIDEMKGFNDLLEQSLGK